jgi:hypothetical protein
MPTPSHARSLAALALCAVAACADTGTDLPTTPEPGITPKAAAAGPGDAIAAQMDAINVALEAEGAPYRVAMAEYIAQAGSGDEGGTVFAKNVGNKQLTADFVPGDPRRAWSGTGGTTLTYAIDQVDAVPFSATFPQWPMTAAQTNAAITTAMATWEAVGCSTLGLSQNPDFGLDIGIVAFQNGLGGSPFVFADIQHAGFTDINFAGGVLGATYTFVFTGTDIDGNGKADVAFREIYYDPSWIWTDGAFAGIDVESIAVHEVGHGLSQAHFGKVWVTNKGELKASPRAVMNALYADVYRSLAGTDNGGHCSNWASWPNN